jgi:hypothetical protein
MKTIIISFLALGFALNLTAQKIDINTLNLDQLNLYKARAVKLRNTGLALSLTGAAALGIGVVIFEYADKNSIYSESNITVLGVTSFIFFTCELIGIPLWITGGVRKYKANVGLMRFDTKKDNTMALGLGVTLRF